MVNESMKKLGENPSIIRDLAEKCRDAKAIYGEDNVFDFSIGNPSIPTPEAVTKELHNLLNEENPVKLHEYTPARGYKETREAIAEYTNNKFGVSESSDLVYVTMGASAALSMTLTALLNKEDEAIVFAPYFIEYKVYVNLTGAKLVEVETDQNFLIDIEKLEKAINKNTKVILYNSPNNPTGVLYPESLIVKLTELLKKKEKEYNHPIYLISDEPYRDLIYTDDKYPFITKYYDDSLVIYSFSKSLSLPGERIGYVIVGFKCANKEDVYNAIDGAGRSLGYTCSSSMYQRLIPRVIDKTADISIYKKNRDDLMNILDSLGYKYAKPSGAFYLYVKALEEDANKFVEKALKYNLFVVPSDQFGSKGYVRVSYCVDNKTIKNSYKAFKALKEEYEVKHEWFI